MQTGIFANTANTANTISAASQTAHRSGHDPLALALPAGTPSGPPRPQSCLLNGSVASSAQGAQSTARFFSSPRVHLLRMAMRRIDRVSPTLAARLTHALISTPPRYKPKPSELVLRASAHQWKIPFQDGWLQCYRWGKGPVCLFVHCWGGRGTQADEMIKHLAKNGMCVVSFDHPAHGHSSGNTAEMVRMAAAVTAVIEHVANRLGPVHTLIGHSLGVAASAIALRDHALRQPAGALPCVGSLVSISSLTHCTWFTEVVASYLGISDSTVARARGIVDDSYAKPVGWEALSVVDMLPRLRLPILVIHDCDDLEIPFEHGLKISHALPQAQFLATTGQGHRRILKAPAVLDLVTQFAQFQGSAA
jgi:Serine aminopeptidase, S33